MQSLGVAPLLNKKKTHLFKSNKKVLINSSFASFKSDGPGIVQLEKLRISDYKINYFKHYNISITMINENKKQYNTKILLYHH